jgi:hypothetical protein
VAFHYFQRVTETRDDGEVRIISHRDSPHIDAPTGGLMPGCPASSDQYDVALEKLRA